jgi:hypothetical protein
MQRFWFEFEIFTNKVNYGDLLLGCGVTANDYDDALELLKQYVFTNRAMPEFLKVVEDVDISTLDENHVLPNMGNCLCRGVWFPLGFMA